MPLLCCTRNRTSKFTVQKSLILENAPEIYVLAGIGQSFVDYTCIDEFQFTRVLMVLVDEGKQIWLLSGFPIEFERFYAFTVGMI